MAQAIIVDGDPRRPWLAARSRRSLMVAGIAVVDSNDPPPDGGPWLLLKAGQVLRRPAAFRRPPHPAERPLVAIGLPVAGPWVEFHDRHGGDYPAGVPLPPVSCEWHSEAATARCRLSGEALPVRARLVHWQPLDLAPSDDRPAVYQVVTSLQHGGAEKVARELALALPQHGVGSRLVVLGRPRRAPLPMPPETLDLSHLSRDERVAQLVAAVIETGADVLHLHLTDAAETRALAASGIPVMATVHNTRAGWPRDWERLQTGDLALMLACSQAVAAELREALPHLPVRTVWNGIRPNEFPDVPPPDSNHGYTLACVANPRPQKRLEQLPAILAATRSALAARGVPDPSVRLVIAGETSPELVEAVTTRAAVTEAATRHGLTDAITWTDGRQPVRDVIAACHAVVSCSAHEGLSLAHLEALSSGRPLVACDTGGTRELAWRNPALRLLDGAASPAEFGAALAEVLLDPPPSAHGWVWRDFTTERMAARVAGFVRRLASQSTAAADTLWFVTNNLSTGGAQSSLRRLAKAIHRHGHPVRLALLQEYPEHPTPGRMDLLDRGVGVFVPPPAGLIEPTAAVDLILAEMAAAPPRAVVFWNAITTHKLLLADALAFTPVHDISPGEMWFSSFDRCMEQPPPGLPYRSAGDYGPLLESLVVKYHAEAPRAAALGTRVVVIPNGVELPSTPLAVAGARSPLVFGTAVRISPQKRLDELIEAFRLALPELPTSVLRIAGGVETGAEGCAAELRRQASVLPIEWCGETADVARFHRGCDIFVMISDPAGCPNASLEALAAGLPVIATDVGGASEQVIDGITGRLVPARDPAAFARAMVDLAADPTLRETMAAAGREHIRRHFTLVRMTRDYLALLLV